ncbi:MAG: Maf family protein, partial [Planctomycetaceae bacterium]
MTSGKLVLGSRSPRRRELLARIVPEDRIEVVPPASAVEPGFAGLGDWDGIEARLRDIALGKSADVMRQIAAAGRTGIAAVVAADTVIVAGAEGRRVVLGQPPDDESWREAVREWFHKHLLGRTHIAATALCVA